MTALLPLAAFPMLGVLDARQVAQSYGHELILLLGGGFMLSRALERSGAHRRLALAMVRAFGGHSGRALLTTEQVLARAQSHGLREIHSLERDGATWSLEARNARNQKVEVRLSGHDGRILHSERDGWLD